MSQGDYTTPAGTCAGKAKVVEKGFGGPVAKFAEAVPGTEHEAKETYLAPLAAGFVGADYTSPQGGRGGTPVRRRLCKDHYLAEYALVNPDAVQPVL